jgi:hypothetical protein
MRRKDIGIWTRKFNTLTRCISFRHSVKHWQALDWRLTRGSIGNRIYWTHKHKTPNYALQINITHRIVFSVTVFTTLLGIGFQRCSVLIPSSSATDLAGWQLPAAAPIVKIKIILRLTVCLGVRHPSGAQDQTFITVRHLRACWRGAPSLNRGRVCRLQLLLVLGSAIILGSESSGIHDHILLSQIGDSANMEGQVPVFITRSKFN